MCVSRLTHIFPGSGFFALKIICAFLGFGRETSKIWDCGKNVSGHAHTFWQRTVAREREGNTFLVIDYLIN